MDYVIGMDFGTDSVRATLFRSSDGSEVSQAVHQYRRWNEGKYCDAVKNQFRQHPQDYVEGLTATIRECLQTAPGVKPDEVRGIGVDTTGSTPVAVDVTGTPLALLPGFEENPNAMFILWKDHTAIAEADEINDLAHNWGGTDYTRYSGGVYSSEWFWAKILHILRTDSQVAENAYSWLEHCDWIPALLTGTTDVMQIRRSRCAAGHKAMWHEEWDGLPSGEFLGQLDPRLADLRKRLYRQTYTAEKPAGQLSVDWAETLGLTREVIVSVGTFDAHSGGLGAEIEAGSLVKVMGTSTCDMMVAPIDEFGETLVSGICGQVNGSIIPGMLGLEAGQSAFGDVLAWFRNIAFWAAGQTGLKDDDRKNLEDRLIDHLSEAAQDIPPHEDGIVALDWMNGRRTPYANQALKGAITNLNMGSDAPRIFRALVESICFGSRKIVERFLDEGVEIEQVVGIGGVAKKSAFVMQTLSDVLNMPIKVAASEQAPSLGAAMLAATAAGLYENVHDAKAAMGNGFDRTYHPIPEHVIIYDKLYKKYIALGAFVEDQVKQIDYA